MKLFWITEKRKIKDLIPAEYNPRQMTEKQAKDLTKSIQKFDLVEIPAVDQDGTILAGHQRLTILQQLGRGEEEIDVRVPNRKLTDAEAKEYNLRSNKNTGEWDLDKLFAMPEGLLEEVGWDKKEIQKLIDGHTDAEEDDYDLDKGLQVASRCEKGEIWQLGSHRLMCGDSTSKQDVERLMDGKKADICFTSPPYNVGHNLGYKSKDKYNGNGDDMKDYDLFLQLWTEIALENSRYVFNNIQILANNKNDIIRYLSTINDYFCDIAFWKKSQVQPAMAENVMNSQVELILILSKESNSRAIATGSFRGSLSNFIETSSASKDNKNANIHNATMPLDLCFWAIKNFTKLESTVYDPFGGSGSTLIACEQTKRICYMMEIDPKYCTVILDRWEKLTGQKAVKVV